MNSNNPDTCFLASTSRKNAIRLWDAYTGKERARIQPRDHMDEPISAQSIAFSRDGVKLYAGFDKCVRVYDITHLSDKPERRPKLGNKSDLRGIISCISTSPVNIGMYACGSYSKDAGIFHENTGEEIIEFLRADDRVGGITHIEFSPTDVNCIVTGSRIDNALHVWDLRNAGTPLYATAKRNVQTNQRVFFSFDPTGNYIMTGNHDGQVSVFTINGGHIVVNDEYILPKIAEWSAHNDVCNGLSLHPYLPLLATTSGQRRIVPPWRRKGMLNSIVDNTDGDSDDWSTDEDNDVMFGIDENQLKIWSYPVINCDSV